MLVKYALPTVDRSVSPSGDQNSTNVQESLLPRDRPQESSPPPATTLHTSSYILYLTALYTALALFAWIVTSILTFRPITVSSWARQTWYDDPEVFATNEKWYDTARVIQSIVSVLTIPLTSAVCSNAAVVFVQRIHTKPGHFSIRQAITLADKGWTDPATYGNLVFAKNGWKRYGSSFLYVAIGIHFLGGIISPLQQVLLSSKTIKTPSHIESRYNLLDIPDQWYSSYQDYDGNLGVLITRSALSSSTLDQPQAQLWQPGSNRSSCNPTWKENPCAKRGTLDSILDFEDSFLAELASGYNTGSLHQFLPRFNSSATVKVVDADEYPANCGTIPGAFFVIYENETTGTSEDVHQFLSACMPADQRQSPWKNTRDRQDFTEQLFFNITIAPRYVLKEYSLEHTTHLFRVSLSTSAGFFGLPNYFNGNQAGPLLERSPFDPTGNDDASHQVSGRLNFTKRGGSKGLMPRDPEIDASALDSLTLVRNKGPLLTIALAMFGKGSFIHTAMTAPGAYSGISPNVSDTRGEHMQTVCAQLTPLGLMMDPLDSRTGAERNCASDMASGIAGPSTQVKHWLVSLVKNRGNLGRMFTAAAFLANQVWMQENTRLHQLMVASDPGRDTEVPVISVAGIVVVSVLLGLYLVVLWAIAIYSSVHPRWTTLMDSFAMLRLGASMADQVPLKVGRCTDEVKALDDLSGKIGDVDADNQGMGRLGLGEAGLALRRSRLYECYDGDREVMKESKFGYRVYQKE